jgi:hypothetical protein
MSLQRVVCKCYGESTFSERERGGHLALKLGTATRLSGVLLQGSFAAGRSESLFRARCIQSITSSINLLTARRNVVSLSPRLVRVSLNPILSTVPSDFHSSLPFNS